MYSPWLRAFRSAALNQRQLRPATRFARSFHASLVARAADDTNPGPHPGPRDDGDSKPNKDSETGDAADPEAPGENLFGENESSTNGESQGRKRLAGMALRPRTARGRRPEELPPIQLPKSFLSSAVDLYGSAVENPKSGPAASVLSPYAFTPTRLGPPRSWRDLNLRTFEASAWAEMSVAETIYDLLEFERDPATISRRGDILVAAAHCSVAAQIEAAYGLDVAAAFLKSESIPNPEHWSRTLNYARAMPESETPDLDRIRQIVDLVVNDADSRPGVGVHHPALLEEIVMAIRADFLVPTPSNIKVADVQRPVTIINVQDFSGFSAPRDIVRHAANKLGAHVVHIQPSDLAYIVGTYLSQDSVRAPGAISQLAYKVALINGRLQPQMPEEDEEETEDGLSPYIILRSEKSRKDSKKQFSLMEDLLNPTNRGKSEELWEDLKINAALEAIVHAADSDTGEHKPVIIHLGEFNAINMDTDLGSSLVAKLRKIVDNLWLEGRNIVLVGSTSTEGVPSAHRKALRELEGKERVIHLRALPDVQSRMAEEWLQWERRDYIRENDGNIAKVLLPMVEQSPDKPDLSINTVGLARLDPDKLPESWSRSILPLGEVYRIATIMVGATGSTEWDDVFSITTLEDAAKTIAAIEKVKESFPNLTPKRPASGSTAKEPRGGQAPGMRRFESGGENHEERLLSGLVNARDLRTTFKDIHAPKETIESVKMLTTLSLIRPEAFSYGVLATDRIPGCLLYGPPGTGKTLLAKAVAKESGANMIEISGASINNMYVGESEKNVRALFSLAKKREPMVIFIDEADALLGARGGRENVAKRETINQFLREWDGIDKMKAFIMVATNRPFDLDEAVLRRLPRKLLIDLPLEKDRAAILRIHLKDELLDEASVSIEDLARRTPLYSGSDLKNVCVAAAMAAVKEQLELEEKEAAAKAANKEKEEGEEGVKGIEGMGGGGEEEEEKAETPKRVLAARHFEVALREIGASVSEDMATLSAIRKFDEKYGDSAAARRKRRKGIGFGVVPEAVDSEGARVRGSVRR
ncbi:hypothetical protein F4809DRAFT_607779 [Biscogniauxia mediterranea]|nr:hypothetical protein F4809DRAFT_607779 [Biscogniauxia mediterranea]